MEQIWKIVPAVATPYALLAFVLAAAVTAYCIRTLLRYKALDGVQDPKVRLQMSRDLLGLYVPAEDNLRIDQKAEILKTQIANGLTKFKWLTVAGVFLCTLLLVAVVLIAFRPNPAPASAEPPTQTPQPPKSTTLNLRLEEDPYEGGKSEGLKQGRAKPVAFTLSNPLAGLAIVDGLALEVLDMIEDETGSIQAIFTSFKYPVELTPEKGKSIPFGEKYKYAPGDVDRIIIGVKADTPGYDYFVRVVVHWHDDVLGEKRVTVSEPLVLTFPAQFKKGTPQAERDLKREQQQAKIDERLRQLRAQPR